MRRAVIAGVLTRTALIGLGWWRYADRGRLQEAAAEYETAIRLRPDFAPPLVNASAVYSQLGQDGKAEEADRANAVAPSNRGAKAPLRPPPLQ